MIDIGDNRFYVILHIFCIIFSAVLTFRIRKARDVKVGKLEGLIFIVVTFTGTYIVTIIILIFLILMAIYGLDFEINAP